MSWDIIRLAHLLHRIGGSMKCTCLRSLFAGMVAVSLLAGCSAQRCAWKDGSSRQFVVDTSFQDHEFLRGKVQGDVVRMPCEVGKGSTKAVVKEVEKDQEILVHYIYWNGLELPIAAIDSMRSLVEHELQQGTPFGTLAARYGMDGNRTGKLGWVKATSLVPEFTSVVLAHQPGDVFRVDVPHNGWHYVVRMDEAPRIRYTFTLQHP
jgi:hypothetical protein